MKRLLLILFFGVSCFCTLSSEGTKAFESTYEPINSGDIFIEDARILTGTGKEILKGSILISSNKKSKAFLVKRLILHISFGAR